MNVYDMRCRYDVSNKLFVISFNREELWVELYMVQLPADNRFYYSRNFKSTCFEIKGDCYFVFNKVVMHLSLSQLHKNWNALIRAGWRRLPCIH